MTGLEEGGTPPAAGGAAPAHWVPDFSGQRPPFAPGNALARTHGAYSQRVVGPVAERLVEAVHGDAQVAYLQTPSYQPALRAWAAAEARVIVLEQYIEGVGIEEAMASDRGRKSLLEQLREWESSALNHRKQLGLDPLSRARLGRDVAAASVDVASLLTAEREAAERDGGTPR